MDETKEKCIIIWFRKISLRFSVKSTAAKIKRLSKNIMVLKLTTNNYTF